MTRKKVPVEQISYNDFFLNTQKKPFFNFLKRNIDKIWEKGFRMEPLFGVEVNFIHLTKMRQLGTYSKDKHTKNCAISEF